MEIELFTRLAALSALAVVAVQEVLKLRIVPLAFANRYPVFTNIALSLISAIIVTWQTAIDLVAWTDWVIWVATVSVVAAIVYNNTIDRSSQIKALEGEGKNRA